MQDMTDPDFIQRRKRARRTALWVGAGFILSGVLGR